jgi:hypothetical protein
MERYGLSGGGAFLTGPGAAGIRRRRIVQRGHIFRFDDRPVRPGRRYCARGAQIIGKGHWSALTQDGDLQRKIGSAYAGATNGAEADDTGSFAHQSSIKALHFRLVPPRLALGEPEAAAATRKHYKHTENCGADEITTSSRHHGGENAFDFVNGSSRIRGARASGWSALADMVKNGEAGLGSERDPIF